MTIYADLGPVFTVQCKRNHISLKRTLLPRCQVQNCCGNHEDIYWLLEYCMCCQVSVWEKCLHTTATIYTLHKKATIHQVTTMLATSKKSYYQVITTCNHQC